MTRKPARSSGTSRAQTTGPCPRPPLLPLALVPEVRDVFCYVLRHYGDGGLSVLVQRQPQGGDIDVRIQISDWAGRLVPPDAPGPVGDLVRVFMTQHNLVFLAVMKSVGIPAAQFDFATDSGELVLVDIRTG